MGGGGQKDTTTTSEPWSGAQPFIKDVYGGAQDVFQGGGFGAVADQSPWTQQAQQGIADRALGGGSGIVDQALGQAGQTIGGDYLDLQNNPFFQGAIEYAQKPAIDAYTSAVNNVNSGFAGAGRLGSGAYAEKRNDLDDTLARNLAGAATTAGANGYGQERGLQQQATGMAPGLESAGYGNLGYLGQAGSQADAYQQALANQDASNIGGYANIVQGMPSFGTQNQSGGGQGFNPFGAALGAGAIAAPFFLSDVRLKEDVDRVGSLPTGEGIYLFRYIGEPEQYRGVMAQEIQENYPEAVHDIGGVLAVDYSKLPDCGWYLPGSA